MEMDMNEMSMPEELVMPMAEMSEVPMMDLDAMMGFRRLRALAGVTTAASEKRPVYYSMERRVSKTG